MAFPTIPTGGRVVTGNQTGTSATKTFPSLSGLTKNPGDLLIAICICYQSSLTSAVFSAWGGSFTEFHDSAGTSEMAVGMAYKVSDGTETGTFTVTAGGTLTGDCSFILLSIPGANVTTAPEAGSRAVGTAAAADPASFDPAGWAAEDTLWIDVVGSGMTSGTGAWSALGATPPTNYTNAVDSNTTDNSAVGQAEAGVAFRQLNASAENVGTWSSVDTSNARNVAVVVAVRPAISKQTGTAQISLAGASEPTTRTLHAIKVRARKTNAAHQGKIRATLYESGTPRSSEIESSELTSSFADYTLAIADADAANITSYADLEIRLYGYSASGFATVFEVSQLYLEAPAGAAAAPGPATLRPNYRKYGHNLRR